MSDNIPFEIQMEIIKKVYDVKSLIQFRSVSKPWKSFIDSSDFIKGYGARHTQPPSFVLRYIVDSKYKYISLVGDDDQTFKVQQQAEYKYIRLIDDDDETFKVQQQAVVVSPLLSQYSDSKVVGVSHGLLCLFSFEKDQKIVVIWNPCIRKSFGIALRSFSAYRLMHLVFGFGVCPVTRDPTVVKISCAVVDNMPWHVEVFTLSSGVWNVIPSDNLPRQSIRLSNSTHVVLDKFIYWAASEKTLTEDGESTINHMLVSFDLTTKEFKVVDLPDTLTNELISCVSVSKLRESLVVSGHVKVEGAECCGVWVMEHDSSFRKLFTIGAQVTQQVNDLGIYRILGFRKNGEPVFEILKQVGVSTLDVYDPCSQQIKNLGISGEKCSFFMGCYKESLLLLDHSDLHIYSDDS